MIVWAFLIYSSDFNVCTDRARICFNMSRQREKKKKCSFENALVEKSESSTRNKNSRRIVIIFNSNVYLHGFVSLHYQEMHQFKEFEEVERLITL